MGQLIGAIREQAAHLLREDVVDVVIGFRAGPLALTAQPAFITQPEDAKQMRFLGSPTVQINGKDVEPAARSRSNFGFSCRPYNGKGMPERELIRQACLDAFQKPDDHD